MTSPEGLASPVALKPRGRDKAYCKIGDHTVARHRTTTVSIGVIAFLICSDCAETVTEQELREAARVRLTPAPPAPPPPPPPAPAPEPVLESPYLEPLPDSIAPDGTSNFECPGDMPSPCDIEEPPDYNERFPGGWVGEEPLEQPVSTRIIEPPPTSPVGLRFSVVPLPPRVDKRSNAERAFQLHIAHHGSDGYPIKKVGRKWIWTELCGVKGSPATYRRKKDVVEAIERYLAILCDKAAGRL